MTNSTRPNGRFNLESADRWSPHPERDERKFGKVQASVRRQRIHGAGVEEVRSKLLRLHRMSKGFDGNGSTNRLKQAIAMASKPEFQPEPYTGPDAYSSHPDVPADLPTTAEARRIRDEIRASGAAMQRQFRGYAETTRLGIPPAPPAEETAEERIRYSDGAPA